MGEMRNEHKVLVGKPEGKRPLRRQEQTGFRMDVRKIGWE
jgi:hypothetical protein